MNRRAQNLVTTLLRYCRAHYGEVFSYWIHLKILHAFVESVLRYGLPPDFSSVFIVPARNKADHVAKALKRHILQMGDIFQGPTMEQQEEEEEEEEGEDHETEDLPFVLLKFVPVRT